MTQVCLAQQAKAGPADSVRTFTILERAPIRLHDHRELWDALDAASEAHLVIDDKHSKDAFPAKVVNLAALNWPSVERAMSRARDAALAAETTNDDGSVLSRELDRSYDQQQEWLRLRTVLAQAKHGKKSEKRVLLLIS